MVSARNNRRKPKSVKKRNIIRKKAKSVRKTKVSAKKLVNIRKKFNIVVETNVLNEIQNGNKAFEVKITDEYNSPEKRRNTNLDMLLKNHIGTFVGSYPEQTLDLASCVHPLGYLEFLQYPERFEVKKWQKKIKSDSREFAIFRKHHDINNIIAGFITDDEYEPYQGLSKALKSDLGVTRKAAQNAVLNPEHDFFAMCTHPGHHAGPQSMGGYCYINNAAICAKLLMDNGKTVGIVDVDYHGGDGTYECMKRNPNLHFVSIHAKDDYPEKEMYQNGIELPPGVTWNEYSDLLKFVLDQWVNLDVVIISLGFDTLISDPLTHEGGMGFSLKNQDFFQMGKLIASYTKQQIIFIQEGGYDLKNIPTACTNLMKGFTYNRS